jgi:hypothetical protein
VTPEEQQAIRDAALEEAALACEKRILLHRVQSGKYAVQANEDRRCAIAIRALKSEL